MPLTIEALGERLDGLRELMTQLHGQRMDQMQRVAAQLDAINGRIRTNSETIARNCTLIEGLTGRMGQVEEETKESLNRRSIWLGITELVLAAVSWLSPKP